MYLLYALYIMSLPNIHKVMLCVLLETKGILDRWHGPWNLLLSLAHLLLELAKVSWSPHTIFQLVFDHCCTYCDYPATFQQPMTFGKTFLLIWQQAKSSIGYDNIEVGFLIVNFVSNTFNRRLHKLKNAINPAFFGTWLFQFFLGRIMFVFLLGSPLSSTLVFFAISTTCTTTRHDWCRISLVVTLARWTRSTKTTPTHGSSSFGYCLASSDTRHG